MKKYQLENLLNASVILAENQVDQNPMVLQEKCSIINEKHSEDSQSHFEINVMANVILEAVTQEEKEKLKKLNLDFQTDPVQVLKWQTHDLISFLLQQQCF
jgi:predicted oxidoreductase